NALIPGQGRGVLAPRYHPACRAGFSCRSRPLVSPCCVRGGHPTYLPGPRRAFFGRPLVGSFAPPRPPGLPPSPGRYRRASALLFPLLAGSLVGAQYRKRAAGVSRLGRAVRVEERGARGEGRGAKGEGRGARGE